MFAKHGLEGYKAALPGIQMKTLCHGERTLMTPPPPMLPADGCVTARANPTATATTRSAVTGNCPLGPAAGSRLANAQPEQQ